MLGNRGRDTQPEVEIRRLVHASGLRYRVDARPVASIRRRADLVFIGPRVAVFVDGCFWHRCPEHGTSPKSHADYWTAKLDRNVERDRETDSMLRDAGWLVVRVWEHEDAARAAGKIRAAVRRRQLRFAAGSPRPQVP